MLPRMSRDQKALWMRYRGDGWAPTLEMSAAMVSPALGAIALLAAMLLRRDEYTGHAAHATALA
jgi:hypothetical protein